MLFPLLAVLNKDDLASMRFAHGCLAPLDMTV
jgi:hypothetical protein